MFGKTISIEKQEQRNLLAFQSIMELPASAALLCDHLRNYIFCGIIQWRSILHESDGEIPFYAYGRGSGESFL